MACIWEHNWGWPRKRGDRHIQVCIRCGSERESRVQFEGPRFHRTQEAIPLPVEARKRPRQIALPSVA